MFLVVAMGAALGCQGEFLGDDDPVPPPGSPGVAGGSTGTKPPPPGMMTTGTGGAPATGSPVPMPSAPGTMPVCKTTADPGPTPLLKLSTDQYRNTVRDLLAASGVAPVLMEVSTLLSSIPDDTNVLFDALDNRITPNHVNGYFNVARAVAEAITGTPERLTAVGGACATAATLTSACLDTFLSSFARRAWRRPLTADEATRLKAMNDGMTAPKDVFRGIVLSLLTSPRFLNHLEIEGKPVGGREDLLDLSPFEIASRLSYTFWQTMPDDALLNAAADGSIATDAGFATQLDRVMADPRAKETLGRFWREYLKLDVFPGFAVDRPQFKALAAGEQVGVANHDHWADMMQEIRELTEYVAFTKKGTIADLLLTDVSVTRSADLAKLYNVMPWNGAGEPPRLPAGTRAGLLTRAAALAKSDEETNPFHRGAVIRRKFLCDPLPQPDPAALPPGSLDPPKTSAMQTTRQRFTMKTDNPLCLGCHTQFNDIGYALEAYDSLGRHRTKEKVFDSKGALLAELPIDVTVTPRITSTDEIKVQGPLELQQRIVDSKKVDSCFARNYFAFARRYEPIADSLDVCLIEELAKPGVTLADAYRRLAIEASFRRRKVGTP